MKIRFVEYMYCEDWDFTRIIHEAGHAHEVNGQQVLDKVWDGGTRELAVTVELDTDTGIIEVIR